MKIQSRPPVNPQATFSIPEMTSFIRNIMEIEGYNTNGTYRKVLATGAASMLLQMGVISDYQVYEASHSGYYGLIVDVVQNGEYWAMHI